MVKLSSLSPRLRSASSIMVLKLLLVIASVHAASSTSTQGLLLPNSSSEEVLNAIPVRINREWRVEENGTYFQENTVNVADVKTKGISALYGGRFVHAFVKAIMVIIVSEIGDKTFFIAAIFAMKHARSTVFSGAIGALSLMTFLSVALGYAITIIPRWLTFYASVGLFVIFGIKMLHEGIVMDPHGAQEEIDEVQTELRKKDEEMVKASEGAKDIESGKIARIKLRRMWGLLSPVFVQSFTLTFLAEWGDRSQITTIVLGASEDPLGVFLGAVIGHALCTGMAVIGGRMIAQRISVRTVTIVGGIFFILNALFSLIAGPSS